MGSPKQLLPWGDTTLIEHQILTIKALTENVTVVLGAYVENILPVVEKYDVNIVINHDWGTGMGSSIATGIREIMTDPKIVEGVLIALVDQPLVTSKHYGNLLAAFSYKERNIVVSLSSGGWEGVPVVFDKCYFEELADLEGESGAKRIIKQYRGKVRSVSCDEILDDIDTTEKYEAMLAVYKNK